MTDLIANFNFIRPAALVLLPVAALLWWLLKRNEDALCGWRSQIDADLLSALTTGADTKSMTQTTWMFVAWSIATIAIAGPTWQIEPSPFADDATPLMILLKADVSMDTTDLEPSRLERAKLKIADLAEARKGQPLGLIAYAGSAHLVLPPTRDTAIVSQMANEISPEVMPKSGDQLDLAIHEAARALGDGGQGGSVLIVADSVSASLESIQSSLKESPLSVQFLIVTTGESNETEGDIQQVAKQLGANATQLAIDDTDIARVISIATRTPLSATGTDGERWQEAGFWLVPILVLIMLLSFRRETRTEESEASA